MEEILSCSLKLNRSTGRKPYNEEKIFTKTNKNKIKNWFDTWRIRNPNTNRYTFHQQHSSGYIQRRLDYFFISNISQEYLKKPNVLAAFSTDHSPIMFSLFSKSEETGGKGLWKHNNSLCEKSTYIQTIKKHISTLENLKNEIILDEQSVQEYSKYEIRKFSKTVSERAACSKKTESSALETKLKILGSKIRYRGDPEYVHCKRTWQMMWRKN